MRIGVLGGTFDPPHNGHLALARAARDQLELDEVLFVPAAQNPLKKSAPVASPADRIEMLRRAIDAEERLALSDVEIAREGPSYSVDTLGEFVMARAGEYWLLLGADALRGFGDWKSPQRLIRLARLGVVVRPPTTAHDVLARVPPEYRGRIDVVRMAPMSVSSTEIRDRLARGESVRNWIPAPVSEYIETQRLYRG